MSTRFTIEDFYNVMSKKIETDLNPEYLNDFITYMRVVKNRSLLTLQEYNMDIRLFLQYTLFTKFKGKEDTENLTIFSIEMLEKVTYMDIYGFLNHLIDDRQCSSSARARKISAIKSFYKYLTKDTVKILDKDPTKSIDAPKIKQALPKYLSMDESVELLDNVNSKFIERDYCIITLFLNCGMRLSELVGINIDDINFSARTLRLFGKGNKERIIYINDACVNALDNYLEVRKLFIENKEIKDPNAVFLSQHCRRINKRRVQQIVALAIKNAGLTGKGYSPHKLRHTAATLMYQFGDADMLILQQILGHAHVSTTEIYTHIGNVQVEETMKKNPLSDIVKGEGEN
jgi:site-specific recombinase XerD